LRIVFVSGWQEKTPEFGPKNQRLALGASLAAPGAIASHSQ